MKKKILAVMMAVVLSVTMLNVTGIKARAEADNEEFLSEEASDFEEDTDEVEEVDLEEAEVIEDNSFVEEDEEDEEEIIADEEIETFNVDIEELNEFVEDTEETFNEFTWNLSTDVDVFNAGNGSGYSAADAIDMQLGTKYSRTWTASNCNENSYYVFNMPYDGVLCIYIDKPQASSGAYANEYVYLYDANGNEVWNNYTKYYSTTAGYADFRVGITKGTYYINIDPAFKVTSGKLTGYITVSADEKKNCETEANGTKDTADVINTDTDYSFYYGARGDKVDCFAVNLNAKQETTIFIGGEFYKLSNTTAILHLVKPSGEYDTILGRFTYDSATAKYVYTFTPEVTGKYYLELSNYTGRDDNGCFSLSLQVWQKNTDNYTGFKKVDGTWYYYKNGAVDTSFTGMAQYNGTWYYVESGKITWKYTGMVNYGGTWYYIQSSTLKWGCTGMVNHGGTWYYIQNSTLKWGYTGLVNYGSDWYYVQNSTLKWGVNTCARYKGKWYYVNNSKVDFSYTGTTTYNGKEYQVVKGVIQV